MNVIECAEILRLKGWKVYCWRPGEGTGEPDLIAMKRGRLFHVYLQKNTENESRIHDFARAHGARVFYMS